MLDRRTFHNGVLQWSRNFRAAESVRSEKAERALQNLQWSRNFRAAESGITRVQGPPRGDSFNGAATLGLRKVAAPGRRGHGRPPSMEPQL